MIENEKNLLEKAKNRDIGAFEVLIEGCRKKVYNISLRFLGNQEDALDISQEVFIKIFRTLESFKGNSSFDTWVYRITVNLCLDEIRKRKNKNVISIDESFSSEDGDFKKQFDDRSPGPDVLAERKETKRMIEDAVNSLSEEHRTAIILRDIQGFSYEEVARLTDCPEGTVKSRINRARQALRNILFGKKELLEGKYVKQYGEEGWK